MFMFYKTYIETFLYLTALVYAYEMVYLIKLHIVFPKILDHFYIMSLVSKVIILETFMLFLGSTMR